MAADRTMGGHYEGQQQEHTGQQFSHGAIKPRASPRKQSFLTPALVKIQLLASNMVMRSVRSRATSILLIFMLWTQCLPQAHAYSVLTHEEIIDIAWVSDLRPLLLQKFPGLTPEQIKDAHAYAYGGSIIQDLGYYPHGSREFSDLVHYVRSGDFVIALLRDAKDANEYGFALGALAHYASDVTGHPAI